MDEIWERAVETAIDGQTDRLLVRTLTLDGAVKCVQGRMPPPGLLEKFQNLQHLSVANIGVSSLEQFPRLRNLQKLILSDNRIAGGLEFLVEAGLDSLSDLDLSNNRIQNIEDLAPLAQLKLISLDLYECPVTRVKDYRSRVFGLIKSLKYLDKIDAEGIERLESDDEEDEEDEEYDVDEEDSGNGEVDGEERPYRMRNGHSLSLDGVVDVDDEGEEVEEDEEEEEDEESDADDEEGDERGTNPSDGFRIQAVDGDYVGDEEEDSDDGEDNEEIGGEEVQDDDVVEVHEIDDSDDEEGEAEDEEDDYLVEDEDEEGVDNDAGDLGVSESNGRLMNMEEEIDGHEHGEDDEDGDGETGEAEQGVDDGLEFEDEEGDEEDEDYGDGYLVQPVGQVEEPQDVDPFDEDDDGQDEEEVDDEDDGVQVIPSTSSTHLKRKRDGGVDGEEDDDVVEPSNPAKKRS